MDIGRSIWSGICLAFAGLAAAGLLALMGVLPGASADISGALWWKVAGTSSVLALAGVQVLLAARLWGVAGFLPVSAEVASGLHRVIGRVTITVAVVVAVACVVGPAGPTSPVRVLAHSLLGSLVLVILSAKLLVLRVLRRGGHLLPWLGSALFLTFAGIWLTSVADYIAAR